MSLNQVKLYGFQSVCPFNSSSFSKKLCRCSTRVAKKIAVNQNQEMDFALLLKAQTADENQSGLTLRKKELGPIY